MTLQSKRPHRSRLKRGLLTLAGVAGGVLLSFGLTNNATAAPSPSDITAQIDQKWNDIEPTLELYNKTEAEYETNLAKAKDLVEKKLEEINGAGATVQVIDEKYVREVFPDHVFVAARFPLWPVARVPAEPRARRT